MSAPSVSPHATSARPASTAPLSADDLAAWERDGYLLIRGLFDPQEMQSLLNFAKNDPALMASAYGRKDATGQETKLALWNHPTEDLYGLFSRSPRVVDRMEQLLGGEVYHYHTKMMLKEPLVGGAWEWHQDYGYWYHNGCLAPLLASCLFCIHHLLPPLGGCDLFPCLAACRHNFNFYLAVPASLGKP